MSRASRDTWAKRVERWKDSGLPLREFAGEVGVNPSTLSYWKWRLSREAPKSAAPRKAALKKAASLAVRPLSFVELTKQAPSRLVEPFEVELVSGERVRVPSGFDAEALARLLRVLERR
jgi:transposase-like protein